MPKDIKEWKGRVQNGMLPVWIWDEVQRSVQALEGKNMVISLREQKRRRSLSLNAFYWGFIVTPIMEALREFGNMVDQEETHEFLKAHVGKLNQVIVTPDGEIHRAPGSTKKMTGSEMVKYIEMIRAWAAETLDLALKFPNEYPDCEPKQGGKHG